MMRTEEIFFQINLCGTPEVLLANKVSIDSPNQHFRRKPTEFILYLIKDGRMLLTENEQEYDLKKGDMIGSVKMAYWKKIGERCYLLLCSF